MFAIQLFHEGTHQKHKMIQQDLLKSGSAQCCMIIVAIQR
jgi:hypothetical protein